MSTVLITGANRGIGRAIAERYLARGAHVVALVRSPERLQGGPARSGKLSLVTADVTDERAVAAAAASLGDLAIDFVVNNAGVFTTRGPIGSVAHDAQSWQTSLMTNVAAPYYVVSHFLPHLKRGTAPRLAFITSAMGSQQRAAGASYPYRASKAAVTNLARNLAADLAAGGIAVGAYHPGWVKTDMGGQSADITIDVSADGLMARFDALTLARTGVVEDYKGDPVPF
jgi:NAD(P)-dependent dehydrogenase (short-subunit alcohol dehydrogenase family)